MNFKNKKILKICKFLNDEDQYIKAKNIFVKKCFMIIIILKILQTIMKKNSQKNLVYSMPYWYIRVFLIRK